MLNYLCYLLIRIIYIVHSKSVAVTGNSLDLTNKKELLDYRLVGTAYSSKCEIHYIDSLYM